MSLSAIHSAVNTRLATWAPGIPLAWPGQAEAQPENGSAWARIALHVSEPIRASIGGPSRMRRGTGMVHVQLFLPEFAGERLAYTLGDSLGAVLSEVQLRPTAAVIDFDSVAVKPGSLPAIGSGESRYRMKILACSFTFTLYD